ncbi:WG repeat-containing protein [Bacillota bacterium Meth-B3]
MDIRRSVRWAALVTVLCALMLAAGGWAEPVAPAASPAPTASPAPAEGAFVLKAGDGALLVGLDGRVLTERGAYERIERISPPEAPAGEALFAAYVKQNKQEKCVLLNATGQALTGPDYDAVYRADGLIYAVADGLTGLLDAALGERIPCQYTQLAGSGEGFLALNADPNDERPDGVFLIDEAGGETPTGITVLYGLNAFSEGLMPAMDANGRMGYLGARGEWAIGAQYDYAGAFRGGTAVAALGTGAGLIGRDGKWLVEPKYAWVQQGGADGRLLLAQEDSRQVLLLDPDSYEVKKRFEGEDIYAAAQVGVDRAQITLDDRTLLIDAQGETRFEAGFGATLETWADMDGRIVARFSDVGAMDGVWLYGEDGRPVAGPYRELYGLGRIGGRALFAAVSFEVSGEGEDASEAPGTRTTTVIDAGGNRVIEPRAYGHMVLDPSGLLLFESEDRVGAIDLTGREVASFDKKNA